MNITKMQNDGVDVLAAPAEKSPAAGIVEKVVPLESAAATTSSSTPKSKSSKKPKATKTTAEGVALEEAKD